MNIAKITELALNAYVYCPGSDAENVLITDVDESTNEFSGVTETTYQPVTISMSQVDLEHDMFYQLIPMIIDTDINYFNE
jgi:hypothetical protein